MDLLASLGLGTALPEQSTRLTSHPGIIKALEEEGGDDDDVRLGFNKCLTCGVNLMMDIDSTHTKEKKVVPCKGCNRVSYCSSSCRKLDAQEQPASKSNNDEIGIGHSPIICSLLNLCNDDESVEEELIMQAKNKNIDCSIKADNQDNKTKEAAKYRIQTELESYPATLFNILAESPQWFIECMTKRLRHNEDVRSPQRKKIIIRRRGKRDRDSKSSPIKQQQLKEEAEEEEGMKKRQKELVLHIVGASSDSELWGWNGTNSKNDNDKRQQQQCYTDEDEDGSNNNMPDVINAYAEASTNLTSYLNTLLESSISIRCIFIGPDCPSSSSPPAATKQQQKQQQQQSPCDHHKVKVAIPDSNSSTLTIETYSCYYGSSDQPYLPAPDVIILFNPGLSCPDYNWSNAINAACAYNNNANATIPFLITTNTEMEGYADIKYLLDGRYMNVESVPRDILEAVDYGNNKISSGKNEDDNNDTSFFFSENPYAGLRVRQSGTMGNDLFVKNRWVIGGLFSSSARSSDTPSTLGTTSKKKKRKNESTTKNEGGESGEEEESRREEKKARKRHRTTATAAEGNDDDIIGNNTTNTGGSNKNSKKRNPCLI